MNDVKFGSLNPGDSTAVMADRIVRSASLPQKHEAQTVAPKADLSKTTVDLSKTEVGASQSTDAKEPVAQNPEQHREKLEKAVTKLNDYIQNVQRDLQFNVDDDSGRMVVKVVDRKTEEVVRQIPDELALKMAQNLQQEEPLSLFTMKV